MAAAVLSGDQDQFVLLVRRYRRLLLRVAESHLGQPEWAEDVVQETFLAVYRSLHTYNSQFSFRTWLWTILLNQCRRAFAKHARRQSKMNQQATPDDWERLLIDPKQSTPERELVEKDQAQRLDAILRQLPPERADALRLRFYGGLKFQEIADSMGCSLSTAKNRVRWGLTQMAEQLPSGDSPRQPPLDPTTKLSRENPS